MAPIVFKTVVETETEVIGFPSAVTEHKISNRMLFDYIAHCYNALDLDISDDEVEDITLFAMTDDADLYIEHLSAAYFWPTVESREHADLHKIYRADSQYSLFAKKNAC